MAEEKYNLKEITEIYIIESASKKDFEANRLEGNALSQYLSLARIPNIYYQISDSKDFANILDIIAERVNKNKKGLGAITLHFSMHGNHDGVALTSEEYLTWDSFFKILKPFCDKIGYLELPYLPKLSPLNLNFSVCHGYHGYVMKDMCKEAIYMSLVGPVVDVDWADSIVAFTTYYHSIIHKKIGIKNAVAFMNQVNGFEDVFKVDLAYFAELK